MARLHDVPGHRAEYDEPGRPALPRPAQRLPRCAGRACDARLRRGSCPAGDRASRPPPRLPPALCSAARSSRSRASAWLSPGPAARTTRRAVVLRARKHPRRQAVRADASLIVEAMARSLVRLDDLVRPCSRPRAPDRARACLEAPTSRESVAPGAPKLGVDHLHPITLPHHLLLGRRRRAARDDRREPVRRADARSSTTTRSGSSPDRRSVPRSTSGRSRRAPTTPVVQVVIARPHSCDDRAATSPRALSLPGGRTPQPLLWSAPSSRAATALVRGRTRLGQLPHQPTLRELRDHAHRSSKRIEHFKAHCSRSSRSLIARAPPPRVPVDEVRARARRR